MTYRADSYANRRLFFWSGRLLLALVLGFFMCYRTVASTGAAATKTSLFAITQVRYLVRFAEPALGSYNSNVLAHGENPANLIPLRRHANGRARLDVNSPAAKAYISYLRGRQNQHLNDIGAVIGHAPLVLQLMQHASDTAILSLSDQEAQEIEHLPGIVSVDPERELELESDIAPQFTGASLVWRGAESPQDAIEASGFENVTGYLGDGIVIGMIDTGYNSLSPSFQATDGKGYTIKNPLGSGAFIGQCGLADISIGGCNDKVIGVYDEFALVNGLTKYSVEDPLGHGSHTASAAAGNQRTGTLNGYSAWLSGVAPHSNLVVYRACTPNASCFNSVLVASINQAVADGVVDVLNFSISDTALPWSDPVSLAFLAATEAGIFVSAAAGNVNGTYPQVAGTVMNTAPWITTIAAGTHAGGAIIQGARSSVQPDELAPFSLLGPVADSVIKPDLQAPGVQHLAATNNDGTTFGPNRVAMMNGTSAAAAHVSGSAALILGLHPDWTPLEAKSALMLTAMELDLTKPDGVTASDYFDRGSGRVQEFVASKAGLVMDETGDRMSKAAPYLQPGYGGTSQLNLATMQDYRCSLACSFDRSFRSTQDHPVKWSASVIRGPNPGFSSVSVSPSEITVEAFANSPTVTISPNTAELPADGSFHFAELLLTPDDPKLVPLHLPIAVAVPSM